MRRLSIFQEDDDDGAWAMDYYFVDSPPLAVWCAFNALCSLLMLVLIYYMRKHEQLRMSIYIELVIWFTGIQVRVSVCASLSLSLP